MKNKNFNRKARNLGNRERRHVIKETNKVSLDDYNNLKYTIELYDSYISCSHSHPIVDDEKLWNLYCELHLCTWFGCPYLKRYPILILDEGRTVNRFLCLSKEAVFQKCDRKSLMKFKKLVMSESLYAIRETAYDN